MEDSKLYAAVATFIKPDPLLTVYRNPNTGEVGIFFDRAPEMLEFVNLAPETATHVEILFAASEADAEAKCLEGVAGKYPEAEGWIFDAIETRTFEDVESGDAALRRRLYPYCSGSRKGDEWLM